MYSPKKEKVEQVDNNFTYHKPNENQADRYHRIRETAKVFANQMLAECPESRELSLALTKLEEAVMWANASIARNEPKNP